MRLIDGETLEILKDEYDEISEEEYTDTEQLVCPHCGAVQYNHEDDEITAHCCLETCENCGKKIWYSVEVTREYTSRKE